MHGVLVGRAGGSEKKLSLSLSTRWGRFMLSYLPLLPLLPFQPYYRIAHTMVLLCPIWLLVLE